MSNSIHNIASRAMLVCLSISIWTARKFDKRITREILDQTGASGDAGRFNKLLLPGDAAPHRALVKTCNAARGDHYANTLAWSDEGWRLLPSANYMQYSSMMREHSGAFDTALAEFLAAYPDMRETARDLLNGMYRPEDYPSPSELAHKFRFSVEYAPLPAQGDFRLDLPAGEIQAIEKQVQDRITRATREAMGDAWNRLRETVEKMRARLIDPQAIFRDSLVENTRNLVDVLARLNVTGDVGLEAMRRDVETHLCLHDPQTLRDDPDTRQEVAAKADDILKAMSGIYSGAGGNHG